MASSACMPTKGFTFSRYADSDATRRPILGPPRQVPLPFLESLLRIAERFLCLADDLFGLAHHLLQLALCFREAASYLIFVRDIAR
ncbi:hypothetical protein [Burkholderia diffusa]|uniref:hypothetical protein n=1 Tax=Burkholderia diffusa TaxID=488732 RepID=UPI0012D9E1EE